MDAMDSTARQELFDKFDGESYLKDKLIQEWQQSANVYLSEWLHSVFREGKIRGEKLLDLGTGPNINPALYAAPYFNKIYLSDFSKCNRLFLNEWRNGEHSELQRSFFERAVRLEGIGQTPEEKEEILRGKIVDVLYCDVSQPSPLGPSFQDIGQFDAITTAWALTSAVDSATEFRQAVKNVLSLIKPGGYLIMMNIAGIFHKYEVNNIEFPNVKLTGDEEIQIIESVCSKTSFRSQQKFRRENGEIITLSNIVAVV